MEKWNEVFKGIIPKGVYTAELINGEDKGLIVKLESKEVVVSLEFGAVSAVRMLDEGIVLQGLFDDEELNKYKAEGFKNVIYKLKDGDFGKTIKKMSGEIFDILGMRQYLIVTLNYIIEVICQSEPRVEVEHSNK